MFYDVQKPIQVSVNVSIKGFDEAIARLNFKNVETQIQSSLNTFGTNVRYDAITNAPDDTGHLKQSIHFYPEPLTAIVVVNVNYAAYVEFGTRKFADQTVAALPPDWQQFAAQFKGGNGGSFQEFVKRLTLWVHRKGLGDGRSSKKPIGVTGTYSVKIGKRTGSEKTQADEDYNAAYGIALYLLKNGIKAQPFFYPAFKNNQQKLINSLNDIKI